MPEDYARQLLKDFNVTTVPALSLSKIFEYYNIICDEMEFDDKSYSGSLHRRGDETFIFINTDIKNIGRINFTKAHELGHFCLKHKGIQFLCSQKDLLTNDYNLKPMEVEANKFASEFLLPKNIIEPIILSQPFDFHIINYIKTQYMVSKIATAFKILDFIDGNYAVISSQNGKVKHCKVSKSISGKIKLIDRGAKIPITSYAKYILDRNVHMNDYKELHNSCWLRNTNSSTNLKIYEFSRANYRAKTVLTLLYFIEL